MVLDMITGRTGQPAVDRRRMLKVGGALVGATALAVAPTMRSARAAEELTFDVACDGRTLRINRLNQAGEIGVPLRGDTFIVSGSIYPEGTIDAGLSGPDQAGAIGRWTCQGVFVVDASEGPAPMVITSVLFSLGEGISARAGQLETIPDGLMTYGFEDGVEEIRRSVVGGFGRYAGARGEQVQLLRGENDTMLQVAPEVAMPAPNYTFIFSLQPS